MRQFEGVDLVLKFDALLQNLAVGLLVPFPELRHLAVELLLEICALRVILGIVRIARRIAVVVVCANES